MTDLSKILAQEEEDMAETCKDHPDVLATIHNNAGMYYCFPYRLFTLQNKDVLLIDWNNKSLKRSLINYY